MHLLIPAAGMGKRMGSDRNKLLMTLLGQPLLAWTLQAAEASQHIRWIGIMGQPEDFTDFQTIIQDVTLTKHVELIQGGNTRQHSVYNGVQALPQYAQHVLVHDGARCLITSELLDRCADTLSQYQGLIAAIPVKDTIKQVDAAGFIQDTPPREQLWAAQTPQGFEVTLLKQCHDKGRQLGWEVTDDAALFEKCDLPVHIVMGDETNLKVTTPVDLAIAECILHQRQSSTSG